MPEKTTISFACDLDVVDVMRRYAEHHKMPLDDVWNHALRKWCFGDRVLADQPLSPEAQARFDALLRGRGERLPATREIRKMAWDKSGGKCFYCRQKLHPLGSWHVDHVIAVAVGGSSDDDNLVAACRKCNKRKGAKHPKQFLKELRAERKKKPAHENVGTSTKARKWLTRKQETPVCTSYPWAIVTIA